MVKVVNVHEAKTTLSRLLEADVPIEVSGNFRLGDIRHNYADMAKIERLLGFTPAYDFERGIARLAAWAKASGPQASSYEESLAEMRRKGLMK